MLSNTRWRIWNVSPRNDFSFLKVKSWLWRSKGQLVCLCLHVTSIMFTKEKHLTRKLKLTMYCIIKMTCKNEVVFWLNFEINIIIVLGTIGTPILGTYLCKQGFSKSYWDKWTNHEMWISYSNLWRFFLLLFVHTIAHLYATQNEMCCSFFNSNWKVVMWCDGKIL